MCDLGYGYLGARNDTTQQSGQTPDKEIEIKKLLFIFLCFADRASQYILSN